MPPSATETRRRLLDTAAPAQPPVQPPVQAVTDGLVSLVTAMVSAPSEVTVPTR